MTIIFCIDLGHPDMFITWIECKYKYKNHYDIYLIMIKKILLE